MSNEKTIACIAFSDRGFSLAQRLARALDGQALRSGQSQGVRDWTAAHFTQMDAIIFVGAAGIAVRAIAPHLQDKTKDPAVVVIDERALHVIPILSGHLGGANDLARRIAGLTGADCVITTATDVNGVFAVDEWSKKQNCALLEKDRIQHISGRLLAGGEITVYSRWPVAGQVPEGIRLLPPDIDPYAADVIFDDGGKTLDPAAEDVRQNTPADSAEGVSGQPDIDTGDIDVSLDIEVVGRHPLHLVPRICVLGVGCRRGTPARAIEERLFDVLEATCIHPAAICAVATIDLKKGEPGLTSFCAEHGWPLLTYTANQLQAAPGTFTPSAFVASVTGVDNVCERAAVLAGDGGRLLQKKIAGGGVTMALAMKPYAPDWTWT